MSAGLIPPSAHTMLAPVRTYEPRGPTLTVDVVLFTMRAEDLAVLLVRRTESPFEGRWALPGGSVREHEALEQAAARELESEAGVTGVSLEQLGAFGAPGRDPRGHCVSVAYFSFVVSESHPVKASADAADAAWIPLRELSPGPTPSGRRRADAGKTLAFDHAELVSRARERLQERLNMPTPKNVFELVPPRFTLTELQRVYEAVFGRTLDKRNFRARLLSRGLIEPVGAKQKTGRHRPAQLYRWKVPRRR